MADKQAPSTAEMLIFGGIASVVSKTISSPFERYKLILQLRNTIKEQNIATNIDDADLENPSFVPCISQDMKLLWSGGMYTAIRYFPTHILSFMFTKPIKSASIFNITSDDSSWMKFSKKVTAGGIAGGISVAFIYSFDQMATIYQLGIRKDLKSILSYRGFGLSCLGVFLYRAFYFGLYDTGRPMLGEEASMVKMFIFGYCTTLTAGMMTYPIDTICKRQLLTDETAWEAGSILVEKHGWMSLWDGAGVNICRGMIGTVALMLFYGMRNRYVSKTKVN